MNALPKALELPRFPPGTTIQSGGSQAERLEHPEHDRLLAFEAEGVDRVHQVDAQAVGHLADALHRVVEVADDLDRQRAVVERLGELAVGDLARADEDDRLEAEVGGRAVDGQGRRGVPRAGAGDAAAPTIRAWVNAAVMPLSLKLPEGFIPSYWSMQAARVHADVLADLVGGLEQRLPLADRDDHLGRGERQELAEPPDAREVERVEPVGPLRLEVAEPSGGREGGPSRRRRRAGRRTRGRRRCVSPTPRWRGRPG